MVRRGALTRRLFRSSCTGRQYSKFHSHTWRCSCPAAPRQGSPSPPAAGPRARLLAPVAPRPRLRGGGPTRAQSMGGPFKVKSTWPSTLPATTPTFFWRREGAGPPRRLRGSLAQPCKHPTWNPYRGADRNRPSPPPSGFKGSGIHGISAPRLNWGEAPSFPEELSPGLPTSLPAPSPYAPLGQSTKGESQVFLSPAAGEAFKASNLQASACAYLGPDLSIHFLHSLYPLRLPYPAFFQF